MVGVKTNEKLAGTQLAETNRVPRVHYCQTKLVSYHCEKYNNNLL